MSDAINKLGRSAQLAQDLQVRMSNTSMLPDAADAVFAADAARFELLIWQHRIEVYKYYK